MKPKPLRKFTFSYPFRGSLWYFTIRAKSLKDARARLRAIKKDGKVVGEGGLKNNGYCKVGNDWVFVPGLPDWEREHFHRNADGEWEIKK